MTWRMMYNASMFGTFGGHPRIFSKANQIGRVLGQFNITPKTFKFPKPPIIVPFITYGVLSNMLVGGFRDKECKRKLHSHPFFLASFVYAGMSTIFAVVFFPRQLAMLPITALTGVFTGAVTAQFPHTSIIH